MLSVLPEFAKTACCCGASGDTLDAYPGIIPPPRFPRYYVGFVIGGYPHMYGAPPVDRDCWGYANYHSGALLEDCSGHCLDTPLLLATLRRNKGRRCNGGGVTSPYADSASCYGSAPPARLGRYGSSVSTALYDGLAMLPYSACYIRTGPPCVLGSDKWGNVYAYYTLPRSALSSRNSCIEWLGENGSLRP